jgi:RNA polymerase sigma-70 factor (ECF subfamily)
MEFFREKSPQPAQVLDQYRDGLYGYAIVLTHHRTEAEDLVQETCVRAIQALGSLRENSNVKSWLFAILRNIWLNQLRHRRTVPENVELNPDESSHNFCTEVDKDPHALYVSKIESEVEEHLDPHPRRPWSCQNLA